MTVMTEERRKELIREAQLKGAKDGYDGFEAQDSGINWLIDTVVVESREEGINTMRDESSFIPMLCRRRSCTHEFYNAHLKKGYRYAAEGTGMTEGQEKQIERNVSQRSVERLQAYALGFKEGRKEGIGELTDFILEEHGMLSLSKEEVNVIREKAKRLKEQG